MFNIEIKDILKKFESLQIQITNIFKSFLGKIDFLKPYEINNYKF